MKTQNARVLAVLAQGRRLTARKASAELGVDRLAARVNDLRDSGYPIETEMVKKNGKIFAEYYYRGVDNETDARCR